MGSYALFLCSAEVEGNPQERFCFIMADKEFSYDVFISYALKEGVSARDAELIKQFLESEKLKVWFDEEGTQNLDRNINQAVADAISDSAVFLLVSSPEYENSPNCMKEVNFVDNRKPIIHVTPGMIRGGIGKSIWGIHPSCVRLRQLWLYD